METTFTRTRRALFVAMCLLILSLSAEAGGARDAVVTGSIVGEDGKPQQGIAVQAYEDGPSGQELTAAETDAKGAFRIQLSGVERCRLSFHHPDEDLTLCSRVEAAGLSLYLQAGGTLDLGRLTMRWIGDQVHARTTLEGEPVAGVSLSDSPRVNRRVPMVTGEDGEIRWEHQDGAGKRIVLFADDGKDLTGWFVGEVKTAGEPVEADIELTAAEMARRYCEPLPAIERFLAYVEGIGK